MKRSKGCYQKRSLCEQLEYDDIKFRPKIKDIEQWFDILNEELFDCKLPPIDKIHIMKDYQHHALYRCKKQNGDARTRLTMDVSFKDKKTFVEVLAHEMIHHFQFHFDEPLGHGPSFWAWKDNFLLKGLKLKKVI